MRLNLVPSKAPFDASTSHRSFIFAPKNTSFLPRGIKASPRDSLFPQTNSSRPSSFFLLLLFFFLVPRADTFLLKSSLPPVLEYYPGITDPNYLRNSINIGPNERRVINDANLSSNLSRAFFPHVPETGPPVHISRDDFSLVRLHFYDISWPRQNATDLRTHGSSWLVGSFPSVVKSISARIEDKVYGRVFVGSTFRAVHKRIERRSPFFPYFSLPPSLSTLFLFNFIRAHVVVRTLKRDAFG